MRGVRLPTPWEPRCFTGASGRARSTLASRLSWQAAAIEPGPGRLVLPSLARAEEDAVDPAVAASATVRFVMAKRADGESYVGRWTFDPPSSPTATAPESRPLRHPSCGCRLRYRSRARAAWAALYPHIPWAPAPGGVAAEHR
jgi:hypothetical protein